ncbi:MAG: hypothetical protein VB061_11700 [Christensenella sp.]|nr:hypothetical protein [Christensenella sp.]
MNTDHLLTLGMALTTDKRTMERRVRGVFARKRSAKGVIILSLILALSLAFAAFTTACQPGQATVSDSNALASGGNALVSGGDAMASDGNVMVSSGDALTSGGNVMAEAPADSSAGPTKEMAMKKLKHAFELARVYHVPRMENYLNPELGTWTIRKNPDDADRLTAAYQFLKIANAVFTKNYTPNDLATTYYVDSTDFRTDIWRFDSKDGVLSGAVEAETLRFLSADCLNEPGEAMHPSLQKDTKSDIRNMDTTTAVDRVAEILNKTVYNSENIGGSGYGNGTAGWHFTATTRVALSDDLYCAISVFGDQNLTPTTLCVYPDADCAEEGVFWRADLQRTDDATKLLHPQDFRKGTPGADDMTQADAINFFRKLVGAAGLIDLANGAIPPEPSTTFYVDYSGARENYWHVEGSNISFDLTSKTGHMLNLSGNAKLGSKLVLMNIPYEKMGGKEYVEATRNLFTTLFGKDAVQLMAVNAVYDDHYCTIDPFMADGSSYEVMYQDGLIVEAAFLCSSDPNRWTSVPDWLEKWAKTDAKTGVIKVQGIESGKDRYVPNWLADWVYINNDTGEIYAMEW